MHLSFRAASSPRQFLRVVLFFAAISVFDLSIAQAWIETVVRSHQARVTVDAQGQAVVRHELVLKVRGGPLKSLEIAGIGEDVTPLPDAVVRREPAGSSGMWALEPAVTEDGALRLRIVDERGVRGGNYHFEFSYTQDLRARGLIETQGERTVVSWVGPRLSTGVDSAKVIFVVPRGLMAPDLPATDYGAGSSVLLGQVLRGDGIDEVELVRAHLATGEPAVWQVAVDPTSIAVTPGISGGSLGPTLTAERPKRPLDHSLQELSIALLSAAFVGLLVFFKGRAARAAALVVDARVRPLLFGPPWLRGVLSTAASGAAAYFALEHQPLSAAVAFSVALMAATHLLPVRVVGPRGPGTWEKVMKISPEKRRLPGSWFEISTMPGLLLFTSILVCISGLSFRILPTSNYLALMVMLLGLTLLPIYWTGRHADLPEEPEKQARSWLAYLERALNPELLRVELWARRAADRSGQAKLDEARIRLMMAHPPQGLRAFEVAFDECAGAHVMPSVVVRVLVDSEAERLLPSDIPWQRGRSAEERVALLYPTTPARGQLLRLVRSLTTSLRQEKRAARSSGKGDVTAKGAVAVAAALM